MALQKVIYKDDETVITAKNLNEIQDEIIANRQDVDKLKNQVTTLVEATVE
jgi:hypothetical protein